MLSGLGIFLLGMIIVLPFTTIFAHFIENLVKSEPLTYVENLDKALLNEPSIFIAPINIENGVNERLFHLTDLDH